MTVDLETIYQEVESVKHILETLNDNQKRDHEILLEHDKILVRGNGVPSLQENVRNLAKAMNDFMDDVRNEREKREKFEIEERKRKAEEANKFKWLGIGIGTPLLLTFLGQAIVFYVRVYPLIQITPP